MIPITKPFKPPYTNYTGIPINVKKRRLYCFDCDYYIESDLPQPFCGDCDMKLITVVDKKEEKK